jgi:hypothetical protein
LWLGSGDTPAPPRAPVVVELFTSEGCSDCPPADTLLRELESRQPVTGIEIIPLGFHVDYWNELGWRDRFSMHAFTLRQEMYVDRMRLESPYTPQMVVDGKLQAVGNDEASVRKALLQRTGVSKATVSAKTVSLGVLDVSIEGAPSGADIMLAITEGELTTHVPAGENRGRELHHTAVVRVLSRVGSTRGDGFSGQVRVPLNKSWRAENLRAVIFVQAHSGEIAGAASVSLADWRF